MKFVGFFSIGSVDMMYALALYDNDNIMERAWIAKLLQGDIVDEKTNMKHEGAVHKILVNADENVDLYENAPSDCFTLNTEVRSFDLPEDLTIEDVVGALKEKHDLMEIPPHIFHTIGLTQFLGDADSFDPRAE